MTEYYLKKISPISNEALELTNKLYLEMEAIYPKSMLENFVEENSLMKIFIAAYGGNKMAVAGGALKHISSNTVEVKRMYVLKEFRGRGLSKLILSELEKIAKELDYKRIILETGTLQPVALSLYRKYNYTEIPCFGRHADDPTSVCFEKLIY